jgi:hypothetical protein
MCATCSPQHDKPDAEEYDPVELRNTAVTRAVILKTENQKVPPSRSGPFWQIIIRRAHPEQQIVWLVLVNDGSSDLHLCLRIIFLAALCLSWHFFMRTSHPKVQPSQPTTGIAIPSRSKN